MTGHSGVLMRDRSSLALRLKYKPESQITGVVPNGLDVVAGEVKDKRFVFRGDTSPRKSL